MFYYNYYWGMDFICWFFLGVLLVWILDVPMIFPASETENRVRLMPCNGVLQPEK